MNRSLALIPVAFAIFALMVSPVVSADTDNDGRDNGPKKANGCEKGNGKASDAGHNPNCGEPIIGNTDCTYLADANITPDELSLSILGDVTLPNVIIASNWIAAAEINADVETPDAVIDHDPELDELNIILAADTTKNPDGKTCY